MNELAIGALARLVSTRGFVVTICVLLVVSVCGSVAWSMQSANDFLPLGELRAAPQDEIAQKELLDTIVRGVVVGEARRAQGDIRFELVKSMRPDTYDRLLAAVPKTTKPNRVFVPVSKQLLVGPTRTSTRWTYSGSKLRHESRVSGDAEALVPAHCADHSDAVFDGERSVCYYPKEASGRIDSKKCSAILMAPEPQLTLMSVDGKPLSALLQSASVKYEGRQNVGDCECLKISAISDGSQYDIWISPDNDYCAKRISISRTGLTAVLIGEVREFRDCGNGAFFPLSGSCAEFRRRDSGELTWLSGTDWSLTSYSSQVPGDAFTLQFREGVKVLVTNDGSVMSFTAGK